MKNKNIVLFLEIIGIIIGLIGMVLFINHVIDENKSKDYEPYIHYVYDANAYGSNATDLGYNNEINANAYGSNATGLGYNNEVVADAFRKYCDEIRDRAIDVNCVGNCLCRKFR